MYREFGTGFQTSERHVLESLLPDTAAATGGINQEAIELTNLLVYALHLLDGGQTKTVG
jgi:hypothetical protein